MMCDNIRSLTASSIGDHLIAVIETRCYGTPPERARVRGVRLSILIKGSSH